MIVVTGGAGFIGSCFVWKLNEEGVQEILVVDQLGSDEKRKNLQGKSFIDYAEKDAFLKDLLNQKVPGKIDAIFHLGACSSTTETDASYLIENNYAYSRKLAAYAIENDIYFSYASSAATYGDGENGYSDDEVKLRSLRPLNMYGCSKHMFDLWLLQNKHFDKVVGFKYFNVFGPNEYHKGDMRSVICKAYAQIQESGKLRLFKSYREAYKDGEQKRDFVYVKDAIDLMYAFYQSKNVRGIFNLGTGKARTWNDLAKAVFNALGKEPKIEYIEMPENIREKYQYFTEAAMSKAEKTSVSFKFSSLEDSVRDYVQNYLAKEAGCL